MGVLNLIIRQRIKILPIYLFVFLFLVSCGNEKSKKKSAAVETQGIYNIYCINNSETKVVSELYNASSQQTNDLVRELVNRLSIPPEELGFKQAIPDDISVISVKIEEDTVIINFADSYNQLTGVTEVLRRGAVVKTLCQVQGIKYVKYMVSEQPLLYSDMTPVGSMKAEDFIDNTSGETTYYQTVHLTLYYTDEEGNRLFPARHNVEFDGTISLERLVLEQLLRGPLAEEKLMPVIPEKTKINKVSTKDGICYVDFSKEFLVGREGVGNDVIIYSIVNSLSEIGNVTKVSFSVEGEPIELYREAVPLGVPLERKLEIIEDY